MIDGFINGLLCGFCLAIATIVIVISISNGSSMKNCTQVTGASACERMWVPVEDDQ